MKYRNTVAIYPQQHQSRFNALMCLLLCLTLNLQWLAATGAWTQRSNITAQGANLVADGDISIRAANNITLTTATNTQDSQSSSQTKKSGFSGGISPSGISVGYSKSNTNTTGNDSAVTNTGTSIGSIGGNITVQAGNALKVEGSGITAAGKEADTGAVKLSGASVAITDVQNTQSAASTYANKTSGISVGISIPGMSQVQGAQAMASNVGKVTDTRMKAMGAAVAANNAVNAAKSIASGAGLAPSITIGASTSKTSQASQTNSSTSQGSSITGSNVSVSATGKDLDGNAVDKSSNPQSGNLLVQGSKVAGTAATAISATGDIDLLAGQSTSITTTNNSSKSAGASVSSPHVRNALWIQKPSDFKPA